MKWTLWSIWGLACGVLATPMGCADTTRSPDQTEEPKPADSDDDDDAAAEPVCAAPSSFIFLQGAQSLSPILWGGANPCTFFGLDSASNTLYVVDTHEDTVLEAIDLGAVPSDMTFSTSGQQIFVALSGSQEIIAISSSTYEVEQRFNTAHTPARIAAGIDSRVFYVTDAAYSAVHEVNLVAEEESTKTAVEFHMAALSSTPDGGRLFVGESGSEQARLLRFDTTVAGFPELDRYVFSGAFGQPTPARHLHVHAANQRVFYAERAFSAENLAHIRGWVGSRVVASTRLGPADVEVFATPEAIFDGSTFVSIAGRANPGAGATFSPDGRFFYEFAPADSVLHRRNVTELLGTYQLGGTTVAPGSLSQRHFVRLVRDPNPERRHLYGLDAQNNALVTIDADTLLPRRADIIGSQPTDLAFSAQDGLVWVATFGATELAVMDLTDYQKALFGTLVVPGNPYVLASNSNNKAVYVEQDQTTDMVLINLGSQSVLDILSDTVHQPAIAFDPSGRYLFAGDSGHEASYLRRFDLEGNTFSLTHTSDAFVSPVRHVHFHGGFVYYARHKLDASNLAVEDGEFPEDIVAVSPNGTYAFSQKRIYHTENKDEFGYFATVDELPANSGLIAFSHDGETIFQFRNASGAVSGALFVKAMPNE